MSHLRLVLNGDTAKLEAALKKPPVGGSVSSDVRDLLLLEGAARLLPGVDQAAAELRVAVTTRDVELLLMVCRKFPSFGELFAGLRAEHQRSIL